MDDLEVYLLVGIRILRIYGTMFFLLLTIISIRDLFWGHKHSRVNGLIGASIFAPLAIICGDVFNKLWIFDALCKF